jgi:hypothetical protein
MFSSMFMCYHEMSVDRVAVLSSATYIIQSNFVSGAIVGSGCKLGVLAHRNFIRKVRVRTH